MATWTHEVLKPGRVTEDDVIEVLIQFKRDGEAKEEWQRQFFYATEDALIEKLREQTEKFERIDSKKVKLPQPGETFDLSVKPATPVDPAQVELDAFVQKAMTYKKVKKAADLGLSVGSGAVATALKSFTDAFKNEDAYLDAVIGLF